MIHSEYRNIRNGLVSCESRISRFVEHVVCRCVPVLLPITVVLFQAELLLESSFCFKHLNSSHVSDEVLDQDSSDLEQCRQNAHGDAVLPRGRHSHVDRRVDGSKRLDVVQERPVVLDPVMLMDDY